VYGTKGLFYMQNQKVNTVYPSAVIGQVTQLNSMKYSWSILKNLLTTCACIYISSSVTAGVTLL